MTFDCYAMHPSCLSFILAWRRQKGSFCFLYMQESWHTAQLERSLPGFVVQKENVLCRSDMPKSGTSLVLTVSMEMQSEAPPECQPKPCVCCSWWFGCCNIHDLPRSWEPTQPQCLTCLHFFSVFPVTQTMPSTIFLILEGTQMPLPY